MKDIDEYVEEKEERIQEYIRIQNHGQKIYWGNFIRTIIEDRKPKVSREFVEEHKRNIESGKMSTETALKYALLKAGVEVKK